jgi:hypothetical protein
MLELQPPWLSRYLLGEPESFTMVYNSTELLYALYCVYIGDQSPIEFIMIKKFITMLRTQSPPYSSDSIILHKDKPIAVVSSKFCVEDLYIGVRRIAMLL